MKYLLNDEFINQTFWIMITEDKDNGSKKIKIENGGEWALAEKKEPQTNSYKYISWGDPSNANMEDAKLKFMNHFRNETLLYPKVTSAYTDKQNWPSKRSLGDSQLFFYFWWPTLP